MKEHLESICTQIDWRMRDGDEYHLDELMSQFRAKEHLRPIYERFRHDYISIKEWDPNTNYLLKEYFNNEMDNTRIFANTLVSTALMFYCSTSYAYNPMMTLSGMILGLGITMYDESKHLGVNLLYKVLPLAWAGYAVGALVDKVWFSDSGLVATSFIAFGTVMGYLRGRKQVLENDYTEFELQVLPESDIAAQKKNRNQLFEIKKNALFDKTIADLQNANQVSNPL